MVEKVINKLLDLTPNTPAGAVAPENMPPAKIEPDLSPEEKAMEDDFARAVNNIRDAIMTAKVATEYMFEIAKDKEEARSFDALNSLLKNITDANKTLFELHSKRQEFKEKMRKNTAPADGGTTGVNIQNAIFTGTPKDLKRFIEDQKKDE